MRLQMDLVVAEKENVSLSGLIDDLWTRSVDNISFGSEELPTLWAVDSCISVSCVKYEMELLLLHVYPFY